jgi:hypothetical protein
VPNTIIIDNKTNFTGKKFLEFANGYSIWNNWASVEHPRTNGQLERVNGMVLQGLKPCIFVWLKKFDGRWVEELPAILKKSEDNPQSIHWVHPFFLTYGYLTLGAS